MKKMISLLLALTLALTLCACVTPKTPMPIEDGDKSAAQPVTVRLGGLKGPTSMGMVKLFDDADNGLGQNAYTYTIAASANELTPQLVQGELDVLAVPANVAAILYNQTEGSVVLLCGEYLFCGDTLFAGSIGRTDLEGGSSAQMAESLRKLAKLPIPRETQVLPGHGECSTFGDELDNNYFIRSAVRGNNDLF